MDLGALGFDEWFETRSRSLLKPGFGLARVTAVDRGAFRISSPHGEAMAELSGKFRHSFRSAADVPCVGDWVCVQGHDSGATAAIHASLPRKTVLRRKHPGRALKFQMIAANIDVAFIVQACDYDFNLRRLERYLLMTGEGRIEPRLVLTKTDLIDPAELDKIVAQIRAAGLTAPVLPLSNTTGSGLEELQALLAPGRTYCLLGSSGVGKTTLVNRLIGDEEAYATSEVSDTGEGVHTTARRQLHLLPGGAMVVDTPGMRELGLPGLPDGMKETFAAIHALAAGCRFSDCGHKSEPDCAVRLAVANGELSDDRYQNYLKLRTETAPHARKRDADASLGRAAPSATDRKTAGKKRL